VGEDSFLFYAVGQSPTSNTRNLRHQLKVASNPKKSLDVARRMFKERFPEEDVSKKSLKELMGMEGYRVQKVYENKAQEYKVGWKGRSYIRKRKIKCNYADCGAGGMMDKNSTNGGIHHARTYSKQSEYVTSERNPS
jgi:glucan biosynthesis protein